MLVIAGPTASGKTSLAIKIAKKIGGEIVAADSRTVYKGMDIGTAKPTLSEMQGVKHYCLDLVYPGEPFTVADFVKHANKAKAQIISNGHIPIVVGGSGLFIDSFIYKYSFVKPNQALRAELEQKTAQELTDIIIKRGLQLPNNYKNKRHLLATLERVGQAGSAKERLPKGTYYIALKPPKEELVATIEQRINVMFKQGLVGELEYLFAKYPNETSALNGGVYKLATKFLGGQINTEQFISEIIKSDIALAKKQITWLRRNSDIVWFSDPKEAYNWVMEKLKK